MNTLKLPNRATPPDDRAKALRRIDALTAAIKAANGRERYWRAVALTCLNSTATDPAVAAVERFAAGLAALWQGLEVDEAPAPLQLSPEAAESVLTSPLGPHLALYLANDPPLMQSLGQLAPADQLVELGRLSVAVEAALLPPSEQPRCVKEVFGLATRGSA